MFLAGGLSETVFFRLLPRFFRWHQPWDDGATVNAIWWCFCGFEYPGVDGRKWTLQRSVGNFVPGVAIKVGVGKMRWSAPASRKSSDVFMPRRAAERLTKSCGRGPC